MCLEGGERERKKVNKYGEKCGWPAGHRTIGSLLDKRRVTRRKLGERELCSTEESTG